LLASVLVYRHRFIYIELALLRDIHSRGAIILGNTLSPHPSAQVSRQVTMQRLLVAVTLGTILCGVASPSRSADQPGNLEPAAAAASPEIARDAAERMLGSADEEAQQRDYMIFTRQMDGDVVVAGSLRASFAAAGIPTTALLEAERAFGTTVDLVRDPRDGDRLHVGYEQGFTIAGNPVGVPKLLWAAFQPANKPAITVYRFRPNGGIEQFWLTDGGSTAAPRLQMPVEGAAISSAFGMRNTATADLRRPGFPMGPLPAAVARPARPSSTSVSSYSSSGRLDGRVSGRVEPLPPVSERVVAAPVVRAPMARQVLMHEGVDLAAPLGAPVLAAGDGVVRQAEARGGYGNWVMIDHDGGHLSTGYAHLLGFAPGLVAGARVKQGEVIAFVGNTGHSTGPHLHYEVWVDGKAENPIGNPATLRTQLRGPDLARFQAQVRHTLGDGNGGVLIATAARTAK
jgi:murein DD-endopeptidase MepM/ murein hydrolase activator NlpD